jgi:hypothetical protein
MSMRELKTPLLGFQDNSPTSFKDSISKFEPNTEMSKVSQSPTFRRLYKSIWVTEPTKLVDSEDMKEERLKKVRPIDVL